MTLKLLKIKLRNMTYMLVYAVYVDFGYNEILM